MATGESRKRLAGPVTRIDPYGTSAQIMRPTNAE
jgi:hypothetical protein